MHNDRRGRDFICARVLSFFMHGISLRSGHPPVRSRVALYVENICCTNVSGCSPMVVAKRTCLKNTRSPLQHPFASRNACGAVHVGVSASPRSACAHGHPP